MKKVIAVHKPIQADDYGKAKPKPLTNKDKAEIVNTDGRKVLALWSH